MARLQILAGAGSTTHELEDTETVTIGRGPSNRIALADLAASSRHSQLVKDSLGWRIEDRGSRNGTFVNGEQIQSAHLRHGDQIQVGATEILFEDLSGTVESEQPASVSHASSFLQSIVAEIDEKTPGEFGSGLLHSLVIDDSEEDPKIGSQFEFLRVDGRRPQRNTDTLVLKPDPSTGAPLVPGKSPVLVPQTRGESLAEVKLRLIQRVSEKLVRIFDPKQLMDEIMSIVIDQAKADRGILCLLDEHRQPVPIATRGLGEDEQVRFSRNVLQRLLDERAGVVIGQTGSTPAGSSERMLRSLVEMRVYSTMCVPLWTGDNIIGILSLDSTTPGKFFTQEDLELLLAVAHQAAIGIERGRLSQMVENERQARAYMSKYLDNRIVQHIADHKTGGDPLAPAERVVTVLFSDIVSFTKMSEGLQPAELASFVREYLTAMTEIIFAHGGTIDKYIGDAVMALFGAPVPNDDSPAAAVRAALEMRERMHEFKLPGGKGGVLRARFGINTGLVVVGNIGSARRMEYTALGDAVNVASRLQTFARPSEICIDEVTHAKTGGAFVVEEIGTIDVKNRAQGVVVYKVLRAK
jgi:adenylate cyclase